MDETISVPLELVDHILEDCDRKTLLVCSLVCKSWLPFCKPQIFESVKINTMRSSTERNEQLLSMAQTAGYIRHLSLGLALCTNSKEKYWQFMPRESIEKSITWHALYMDSIIQKLDMLADKLQNLHFLKIMTNHPPTSSAARLWSIA
ncbi:hypothetical protein PM082_000081 [Marasmius tenuissimus]|nr:hypothetical protein PM082_000081 [Marasmius tenuissimus]